MRGLAFRLQLPALARERAAALVGREPLVIALHASGGREIKQWPPERFAEAAARVARELDATLVLTGYARMNGGTVRGDTELAGRFRSLFFAI